MSCLTRSRNEYRAPASGASHSPALHRNLRRNLRRHSAIDTRRNVHVLVVLQLLVVRPKSRGSITLRSADPFEPPHIDAGFCSDPEGADMQTLRCGIDDITFPNRCWKI